MVVSDPKSDTWLSNSIEFCGGTHMRNTAEARAFVITDETAVAKGIRRIVAVTGDAALQAQALSATLAARVASAANASPEQLQVEVTTLRAELEKVCVCV